MKRTRPSAAVVCLSLALLMFGCATPDPHLANSVLSSAENINFGKRIPVRNFTQQDIIVWLVDVAWTPPTRPAGRRYIETSWYKDHQLISEAHEYQYLMNTPYSIWSRRAAATLGIGHFKVQTAINDEVIAVAEFDVLP